MTIIKIFFAHETLMKWKSSLSKHKAFRVWLTLALSAAVQTLAAHCSVAGVNLLLLHIHTVSFLFTSYQSGSAWSPGLYLQRTSYRSGRRLSAVVGTLREASDSSARSLCGRKSDQIKSTEKHQEEWPIAEELR